MMGRRLALLGLGGVGLACIAVLTGCHSIGACGWGPTGAANPWPSGVEAPLLVALVGSLAWLAGIGLTVLRVSAELRRLPFVGPPPALGQLAADVGIRRLVCIADRTPIAFCAGWFRPTVFVSVGALAVLSEEELAAVLHHEADHARRREPLRRAARGAAASVLPFLPLVGWWSDRRSELSELTADLTAERAVGRQALAGALLTMTAPPTFAVAFAGQAELRARRLLGDEVEARRVPRQLWVRSAVYSLAAVSLAACLVEGMAVLN